MDEQKKYKSVCVVDENGFFRTVQRAYRNPRDPSTFLLKPNAIDTDPPDHKKLRNYFAKWDHINEKWEYIDKDEKSEETDYTTAELYQNMTDLEKETEALRILTFVRNERLKDTDVYVLRAFEANEPVEEDIRNYRDQLRKLPNQIRDGVFETPVMSEKFLENEERIRKTPASELIIFKDWPKTPEKITHGI